MPILAPIAGMGAVATAVLAVLIVYGLFLFVHLMAALVRGAPLVGSQIADWIEGVAADWIAGVRQLVDAAAQPAINLFRTPARAMNFFVSAGVAAADHVMSSVVWVSTALIPAWGRAVLATAAVAIAQVHGFANAVLTELRSFEVTATGQVARLQDWVAGTVVPGLQHDIGAVQTFITSQLIPWVSGLVRDLQNSVIDLSHRADAQTAQIAALGAALGAIPGYVEQQVSAGVAGAEGAAQGLVGAAVGTLSVPLATALSEATTAATFVRECGEPMCNWWNTNQSGLGKLLQAVELGALGALIAEAVDHPDAVARDAAAVSDTVRDIGAPVLDLLGVRTPTAA